MTKTEIEKLIDENLIRKDGQINSPLLRQPRVKYIIDEIIKFTNYLEFDSTIARRIWHIRNGADIPKCQNCGNSIRWDKKYRRFCSQICGVTSNEARERLSKRQKGKKPSAEAIAKIVAKNTGKKRTQECKDLLRSQKLGSKNPQFGKDPWNKGTSGLENSCFGRKFPDRGLKGEKNPQFGKSPSPEAGRGISGKFNGVHFRSSLEMLYLMYWVENKVEFITAETHDFRVKYLDLQGGRKSYSPDFYLKETNELVEIKPEKLHTNEVIIRKLKALQHYHPDKICKLIGFRDICSFIIETIQSNKLETYFENGQLIMKESQKSRLAKNKYDILRHAKMYDPTERTTK